MLDPPDSSPSVLARVLAFGAIVVAGACGGLIGYAVTDITCDRGCTTAAGFVGLGSAVTAAIGTGIVAVLTLRAAVEWRSQQRSPPAGARARPPKRPSGLIAERGHAAEPWSEAVARAARERSEQERETHHREARRSQAIRARSKP